MSVLTIQPSALPDILISLILVMLTDEQLKMEVVVRCNHHVAVWRTIIVSTCQEPLPKGSPPPPSVGSVEIVRLEYFAISKSLSWKKPSVIPVPQISSFSAIGTCRYFPFISAATLAG